MVSLAGKIYVPHSEEEYQQLVALLYSMIDEVGEDESHPLASLMDSWSADREVRR
jgi:HTH-type transcriptional regulator / antitoxin HigA